MPPSSRCLRLFARPLAVEGRERLAGLRGPALLIANHASHFDSLTVLAALPEARAGGPPWLPPPTTSSRIGGWRSSPRCCWAPSRSTGPARSRPAWRTAAISRTAATACWSSRRALIHHRPDRAVQAGHRAAGPRARVPVVPIYVDGLFRSCRRVGRCRDRAGPGAVGFPRRIEPSSRMPKLPPSLTFPAELSQSVGYLHAGPNGKFRCRCCGYYTLNEMATGSYEICPVCFWESTRPGLRPDYAGGANKASLNEARRNFSRLGLRKKTCGSTCARRMTTSARQQTRRGRCRDRRAANGYPRRAGSTRQPRRRSAWCWSTGSGPESRTPSTCLKSLAEVTYPNLEAILVNNGAQTFPSERFLAALPGLQILTTPTNLGFTGEQHRDSAGAGGRCRLCHAAQQRHRGQP